MPPTCTEPINLGLNGSETSYWRISPVPQQEAYRNRSSTERLMSVSSGGTALKPCRSGGSWLASAGSAGISMTFFPSNFPLEFPLEFVRCHNQIELDRSFSDVTTPTNP